MTQVRPGFVVTLGRAYEEVYGNTCMVLPGLRQLNLRCDFLNPAESLNVVCCRSMSA